MTIVYVFVTARRPTLCANVSTSEPEDLTRVSSSSEIICKRVQTGERTPRLQPCCQQTPGQRAVQAKPPSAAAKLHNEFVALLPDDQSQPQPAHVGYLRPYSSCFSESHGLYHTGMSHRTEVAGTANLRCEELSTRPRIVHAGYERA